MAVGQALQPEIAPLHALLAHLKNDTTRALRRKWVGA